MQRQVDIAAEHELRVRERGHATAQLGPQFDDGVAPPGRVEHQLALQRQVGVDLRRARHEMPGEAGRARAPGREAAGLELDPGQRHPAPAGPVVDADGRVGDAQTGDVERDRRRCGRRRLAGRRAEQVVDAGMPVRVARDRRAQSVELDPVDHPLAAQQQGQQRDRDARRAQRREGLGAGVRGQRNRADGHADAREQAQPDLAGNRQRALVVLLGAFDEQRLERIRIEARRDDDTGHHEQARNGGQRPQDDFQRFRHGRQLATVGVAAI
ncbi:MAG: hypothetical protein ABT20_05995 [Rubrivivax sp. SCN 70-15]|nr:MAG: hypothetical protein ABT20_05995 [Rubrivivax sp. SCN 70-15]